MTRENKKNKRKKNLVYILVFVLGFCIMIYPIISNFYYRIEANKEIEEFDQGADKLSQDEIIKRMELARAYNTTLDPSRIADPYTDKQKEGIAAYARMLEIEEKIGYVEIPSIDVELPIYAGTSSSVLEKGAGHLEGTSLPVGGESTHTVITAHRGLPKAKMFRNLNKLKKGDIFYIHNIQTILAYEVDQILVVEPSNFEPVLVKEKEDLATLLTCTPYMINSQRLLVRGHRVAYVPPEKEKNIKLFGSNLDYKDALLFMIPLIFAALLLGIYNYKQMKKVKEKVDDYDKKI